MNHDIVFHEGDWQEIALWIAEEPGTADDWAAIAALLEREHGDDEV